MSWSAPHAFRTLPPRDLVLAFAEVQHGLHRAPAEPGRERLREARLVRRGREVLEAEGVELREEAPHCEVHDRAAPVVVAAVGVRRRRAHDNAVVRVRVPLPPAVDVVAEAELRLAHRVAQAQAAQELRLAELPHEPRGDLTERVLFPKRMRRS